MSSNNFGNFDFDCALLFIYRKWTSDTIKWYKTFIESNSNCTVVAVITKSDIEVPELFDHVVYFDHNKIDGARTIIDSVIQN